MNKRYFWLLSCQILLFTVNYAYAETVSQSKIITQLDDINNSLKGINDRIAEANYVNLVVISVSILIAGIAVTSAYATAYFSRKQLEQTGKEIKMRFSPRVIIDGPKPSQVVMKNGGVHIYDDFGKKRSDKWSDVDHIIFKIIFKNIGGDVATNISHIKIVKDEQFTSKEFEEKSDIPLGLILAPNQELFVTFNVDIGRFDILEQKNLFAGLSIVYEDLAGNKKYVGVIYGIHRGSNYIVNSWLST